MVFSSHLFLFWFLPLALCLYYAVHGRARHALLTLVSYFFYGWTNPLFVVLLFVSTLIDYCCGLILIGYPKVKKEEIKPFLRDGVRSTKQKWAVAISVISNLSLLGFFKYGNFGLENWNLLMESLSLTDSWLLPSLHIVLPLGISFYTFQSMSYAIDVYRGDAKGITSFIDFSCYVSMYPQLVAGPIVRFQEVADQLVFRTYTWAKFARGIAFFVLGMGQKILLANPCGKLADLAFDTPDRMTLDAWIGVVSYSFQIFFDFAGYSNMAIGLGLMLGFIFPKNFDVPYRSLSITEFWRRWHISLSTWLRDYLYIPLGGNRKGTARTYVNLFLVMFLGGLWHGAAWTFVIWGTIHGIALAIERYTGVRKPDSVVEKGMRWGYTYLIVLLAWVFFRSASLTDALSYLGSMFATGATGVNAPLIGGMMYTPYTILCLSLAALFVFAAPPAWTWTRSLGTGKWIVIALVFVVAVAALTTQSYNPFIYFIF